MRLIYAVLLVMSVSACGFTPLYETGAAKSQLSQTISQIAVAPINDNRVGQIMHNRLSEFMYGSGGAKYTLQIKLAQTSEGYGIRGDAATTQEQMIVTASYSLMEVGVEAPVIMGELTDRVSYDLVLSDFSTVIQREDSARRLVLQLADRIHRRVVIHLRANNSIKEGQ